MLAESVALGRTPGKAKAGKLNMLKTDVRVGEKIRLVIGGMQHLFRQNAGSAQPPDAAGRSTAHLFKDDAHLG